MGRGTRQQAIHLDQQRPLSVAPGRRSLLAWITLAVGALLLVGGAGLFADWWSCLPDDVQATYVGRSSCVECHATEVEQWIGSDHDLAMDVATDETVLADFNDVEFTHHGIVSRMYRDGCEVHGPHGRPGREDDGFRSQVCAWGPPAAAVHGGVRSAGRTCRTTKSLACRYSASPGTR